jgi:hypothetical protein
MKYKTETVYDILWKQKLNPALLSPSCAMPGIPCPHEHSYLELFLRHSESSPKHDGVLPSHTFEAFSFQWIHTADEEQ